MAEFETNNQSAPGRLASMDAYRGWVMLLMMAEVLRLSSVSHALPGSGFWRFLAYHQSHVAWVGCSLHDMIQPSFSFLVGVALPFSIASRISRGQGVGILTLHAFWRAFLLIILGIFLRSMGQNQTNFTFEDTLTQIGLGYGFLFLLGLKSSRWHWISLALVLGGYWLLFAVYPLPGVDFGWKQAGVTADWEYNLLGFGAHWNKNTNAAWAFDTWFMNLFPRKEVFLNNGGGYSTLSFIPTLGTMILGLLAGTVLRSGRAPWAKARWLLLTGGLCLLAGIVWHATGTCPIVKRIWTPSWTLFSGGLCFLILSGFYMVMDLKHKTKWAFPLVVIGMNSIAAYCMAHLFENFISSNFKTHLGGQIFRIWGQPYEHFLEGAMVLAVFWLILFWMYRRKLFLKI